MTEIKEKIIRNKVKKKRRTFTASRYQFCFKINRILSVNKNMIDQRINIGTKIRGASILADPAE